MPTKIQIRRDLASSWTSVDPVLSEGEIGYETDTGQMKLGNGTSAWTALPYLSPDGLDGGEQVAVKRDAKAGRVVLGVFGDSTGAITTRWPRRLLTELAADNTDSKVGYNIWNDGTQALDTRVAVQAGTDASTAGTKTSDAFTHNNGSDLKGTFPDTGGAWGGAGNATANWTLNGTKIARSSATAVNSQVITDSGSAGDRTVTCHGVALITTGQAAQAVFRLYAGQVNTSNSLYLYMNVSTTGQVSWGISQIIAGTTTTVVSGSANPITANSGSTQTFDVSLEVSGTTVTGTLNSVTCTGTLSGGDAAILTTGTVDGILGNQTLGVLGCVIDSFDVYVATVGPPLLQIEMYNGSFTGSVLTYQAPRLADMCPETPDLVFVNSCHNYTDDTPAEYLVKLNTFIDLVTVTWPTAGIAVMSQNPEKPGTLGPNVAAHHERNLAIRSYCMKKGIGYVPVYEAFRHESDKGVSYVRSDGVHPTDTTDNSDPNGASLWTDTVHAWLENLSGIAAVASPVTSVAGHTGVVTLDSSDLTDSTATGQALVAAASASAARTVLGTSPQIDIFTSSGTWTKASGAAFVNVVCIAAGGGGGSGRRGAAGSLRTGGAGGGGGAVSTRTFPASVLGSTETVTVSSTGGAGGTAITANDTNGNAGTTGGNTTFGSWLRATGGAGGAAGNNSGAATGGSAGGGTSSGGAGGGSSATGGAGTAGSSSSAGAPGGGGGGGITTGDTPAAGGAGSTVGSGSGTGGGTAGTVDNNGGAGTGTANSGAPGTSGGGGGASITTVGGTGGAGAVYGGGGGGGGASLNGDNSGAGGVGGAGICIAVTYF